MLAVVVTVLFCIAVASSNATTNPPSTENVGTSKNNVTPKKWSYESTKSEEKIEVGKKVTFDCGSYKEFQDYVTLKWKKGEDVIQKNADSRYKIHNEASSPLMNQYLTISDITYSDRAKFDCIVNYENQTITKSFTLRVRDPLGPLWPTIGIFVEAIVLFFVIALCSCFNKKKSPKKLNQDSSNGIEMSENHKSSLLKQE